MPTSQPEIMLTTQKTNMQYNKLQNLPNNQPTNLQNKTAINLADKCQSINRIVRRTVRQQVYNKSDKQLDTNKYNKQYQQL